MKRCEAPECEVDFEPKRSTARYCTATCRQRAGRARKAAEAAAVQVEAPDAVGTKEHELVVAVRKELVEADALMTVAGQLALQVARRIADPDAAGISTMSKELRALLAEAKGTPPPGGDEPPTEPVAEPEDDEVAAARRAREAKLSAAAGRA